MKNQIEKDIPSSIYIPLIDSFFQEGRSLLIGSLIAFVAIVACYFKTNEWLFLATALGFSAVAAARIVGMELYNRKYAPLTSREMASKWEIFYLTGASVSVALLGVWCFLAFALTVDPFVRLISFSLTIGYIIGVFGRNFGSSKFVTIQALCAWVPMTVALLSYGDVFHWLFAALLGPLFLGIRFIAQRLRSILLEALEAKIDAETALEVAKAEASKAKKARQRVLELVGRLRQSRRSEEAAIATRDQHMRFLATMSHEIRTPLNGIVGALELINTSKAERVPALLETATSSADALLELVSEVLDLAKLEYDNNKPKSETFNVRDLAEFIRLAVAPIARGKGLALNIELDDALPEHLLGDPSKIRQVLINLVGNALKFTDNGSVDLALHLISNEDGRADVEFEVRDTGVGIAPVELDHIYEPFHTAGQQLNRDTQSSGLGLAIVKKAVENMDGTIDCTSKLGTGTVFKMRLTLPISDAPSRSQSILPALQGLSDITPSHVLLVEDNETNAMIVQHMLEDTVHTVERASGGVEAVRMATEHDYDIILMDISMPDLDGVSACHQIRAARGDSLKTRIVALTANAVVGDRERYLSNGFDGYLPKPIRRAALISTIDKSTAPPVTKSEDAVEMELDPSLPALDEVAFSSFLAERDASRACRLLKIFGSEITNHRTHIETAHSSGAIDRLQHSLHTIVGMAGSVGAKRLAAIAQRHESDCRSGVAPTAAAISDLVAEISKAIDESARAQTDLASFAA